MGNKTNIQWTDATWNPLAGCSPESEGCRNCYAATMALRLELMGQAKYTGTARRASDGRAVFTGQINLDEGALNIPLKWRRPRKIFVNSMSDLFHPNVPSEYIDRVYNAMEAAHWHTFQVLTKRPQRMASYTTHRYGKTPAPNIWHLASVEDQLTANQRVPWLLRTKSAVRGLSIEPLIGPVDLGSWVLTVDQRRQQALTYNMGNPQHHVPVGWAISDRPRVDWLIVGGESGPRARPLWPAWARSLRDQAQAAGVAFMFKQWGTWEPYEPEQPPFWRDQRGRFHDGHGLNILDPLTGGMGIGWHEDSLDPSAGAAFRRVGKHESGRLLDGREWSEFPA